MSAQHRIKDAATSFKYDTNIFDKGLKSMESLFGNLIICSNMNLQCVQHFKYLSKSREKVTYPECFILPSSYQRHITENF